MAKSKEPPSKLLFGASLDALDLEIAVRITSAKRLVVRARNGRVEIFEQSLLVTEEKRRRR